MVHNNFVCLQGSVVVLTAGRFLSNSHDDHHTSERVSKWVGYKTKSAKESVSVTRCAKTTGQIRIH